MVVFGQKWLYSGKSGCIWGKSGYIPESGFSRAIVVVCGQKMWYLGKVVVTGQMWFYWGTKVVVFGQK